MRPPLVPGRGSRSITFFFFLSLSKLCPGAPAWALGLCRRWVFSATLPKSWGGVPSYGKAGGGGSSPSSRSLSSLGPCLPSLWGKKSQVSNEHPRKSRVPIT